MDAEKLDEVKEEVKYQTISEFLESTPPNQLMYISDLSVYMGDTSGQWCNRMSTPEIQLHCDSDSCNGIRFFRCVLGQRPRLDSSFDYFYITYRCSNCQKKSKIFSLAAKIETDRKPAGQCIKFGEFPSYGPPVPPMLIKLIGPDREDFLKGRRCENQGLGIGAFVYYRRVVENQKNRIIGEIIKVSEKIGAPADRIDKLKKSIDETQFTKALEMAKDSMPESLLINGHSPILLLHKALSKGVHSLTDDQCLQLAGNIRIVLGELSERLSQALKDEAELMRALSSLMK